VAKKIETNNFFNEYKEIEKLLGAVKNYKLYKLPYSKAQVVKQLPLWKKRWEKLIK
jgi:hypothetical protein